MAQAPTACPQKPLAKCAPRPPLCLAVGACALGGGTSSDARAGRFRAIMRCRTSRQAAGRCWPKAQVRWATQPPPVLPLFRSTLMCPHLAVALDMLQPLLLVLCEALRGRGGRDRGGSVGGTHKRAAPGRWACWQRHARGWPVLRHQPALHAAKRIPPAPPPPAQLRHRCPRPPAPPPPPLLRCLPQPLRRGPAWLVDQPMPWPPLQACPAAAAPAPGDACQTWLPRRWPHQTPAACKRADGSGTRG